MPNLRGLAYLTDLFEILHLIFSLDNDALYRKKLFLVKFSVPWDLSNDIFATLQIV